MAGIWQIGVKFENSALRPFVSSVEPRRRWRL